MKKHYILIFSLLFNNLANAQCWKSIYAGYTHNVAIKNDNTIWAWGLNSYGGLGDSTQISKNIPTQIGKEHNWKIAVAGNNNVGAIKNDGTLWVWGYEIYPEENSNIFVNILRTPKQIGADNDWVAISVLNNFFGIKKNGTLWAWGDNQYGQLGDGTKTRRNKPTQIGTDNDWHSVFAGFFYTIAIKKNGSLWVWGLKSLVRTLSGNRTPIIEVFQPIQIGTTNDWQTVSCDSSNFAGIKRNGTLWTWGNNSFGQLGDGTFISKKEPIQVGTDDNWQSVSCGIWGNHVLATKKNGTLWAWGNSEFGQLGNESLTRSNVPLRIGSDFDWQSVSAGGSYSIAIKKNNTVWSWGKGDYGNLGIGIVQNPIIKPTYIEDSNCTFPVFTLFKLTIYPNPSSGLFTIKGIEITDAIITVHNILGEALKSQKAIDNTINISDLPSGSYILSILTADKVRYVKMIVKI
jgi:trimeric autotransporter adhesin